MAKKYLLVSEGPTDHKIIVKLGSAIKTATGEEVEIQPLAPEIDLTSGHYPGHGWGGVKRWCEQHKAGRVLPPNMPEQIRLAALRKSWRLLLTTSNATGLIIQMDSDIAHQLPGAQINMTPKYRMQICEQAVLTWIGEPVGSKELYPAIASFSVETWILATHSRSDPVFSDLHAGFDFEHLDDVEDRLLQLGYKGMRKSGRRRLHKSPDRYEAYADAVVNGLSTVRAECPTADALCSYLES